MAPIDYTPGRSVTPRAKTLQQAVDQAIATENARFLADPDAIKEAMEDGNRYRRLLVLQGMTSLAIDGDPLPDGTIKGGGRWVE